MKRIPNIETDTPLVVSAVAIFVWEEASLWLDQPLPQRWIRELIARANTVYAEDQDFRRKIRGRGDSGRDWLWIYTRHWLAALIRDRRPNLYRRLPSSFGGGRSWPQESSPLRPCRTESRAIVFHPHPENVSR